MARVDPEKNCCQGWEDPYNFFLRELYELQQEAVEAKNPIASFGL